VTKSSWPYRARGHYAREHRLPDSVLHASVWRCNNRWSWVVMQTFPVPSSPAPKCVTLYRADGYRRLNDAKRAATEQFLGAVERFKTL
jgi:hypothetical protein